MAAKFSPSEAALSVFSFAKANTNFTFKFMALFALVTFISSSGLALGGFFEYSEYMNAISETKREPTPAEWQEALKLLNPPILIFAILLSLVLGAIVAAIGLRKTVLNLDTGPQFGNNEKNILFGGIGLGLFIIGLLFGGFVIIAILEVITGTHKESASPISIIGLVAILLSLLFINGRYGQFGIFAILNNNNGLKASYSYTKDGFWSFIGAYLLGGAILVILSIIFTQSLTILLNFGLPDSIFSTPPRSASDFFKLGNILFQLLSGAFAGFLNLGFICIGAYIYHQQSALEIKSGNNGNVV